MFYEKHVISYRQGYILCNVSTKLSQRIQSKFIKNTKENTKGISLTLNQPKKYAIIFNFLITFLYSSSQAPKGLEGKLRHFALISHKI